MSASPVTTIDELLSALRLAAPNQATVLTLLEKYDAHESPPSPDQAEALAEALTSNLEIACETGDLTAIESIFRHWKALTTTNAPDAELLYELLVIAAKHGNHEIVRYLLSHGAKVTSTLSSLVASNAAKDINLVEVFRAFIEVGGWDLNEASSKRRPALHYVVHRPDLLAAFVSWGADPNAIAPNGLTPLDAAAGLAAPSLIDQLLAAGARLKDAYPLHQAVATSSSHAMAMIKHLLELGVDINARLFERHPERAELRPDGEDLGTPLHCAARSGSKARVELLLEHGSDAAKRSSRGKTALEWAERARRPKAHPATLRLLAEEVDKAQAEKTSDVEQ